MDIVSKTTELMGDESCWVPLTDRKQYLYLGFFHDTTKLLFVKDYKALPCCPVKPDQDYLWQDIYLSKKSSFQKHQLIIQKDNKEEKFVLQRCHCGGVKVAILKFEANHSFNLLLIVSRSFVVEKKESVRMQCPTECIKTVVHFMSRNH